MTQDEIIEMAIQAGFDEHHAKFDTRMETFAKLVEERTAAKERESLRESFRVVTAAEASAAILHEREACAKVAEDCRFQPHISLTSMPLQNGTAVGIANRIRARAQAERGEA